MSSGILAIETSTPRGSVALLEEGAFRFSETFEAGRSHSTLLFEVLERALAVGRPGTLVVGLGPGSYAGVRIAIAAATGLGLAIGAECVGIPSVVALAEGEYLALGDARRQSFAWSHVREGLCVEGPEIVSAEEFATRLAATRLPQYTSEALAAAPEAELATPSAERLARLAQAGRGIVATGILEPIYLSEPHITLPKPLA